MKGCWPSNRCLCTSDHLATSSHPFQTSGFSPCKMKTYTQITLEMNERKRYLSRQDVKMLLSSKLQKSTETSNRSTYTMLLHIWRTKIQSATSHPLNQVKKNRYSIWSTEAKIWTTTSRTVWTQHKAQPPEYEVPSFQVKVPAKEWHDEKSMSGHKSTYWPCPCRWSHSMSPS